MDVGACEEADDDFCVLEVRFEVGGRVIGLDVGHAGGVVMAV